MTDDMQEIALTGGEWRRQGLVHVWVRKPEVMSAHEWRALKNEHAETRTKVAEIRAKRADVHTDRVTAIITLTAAHFGVTVGEVMGRNRAAAVVNARHVAAWVLREEGMLLVQIGEAIGRDHSSISHGVDRVARTPELLDAGMAVRALVDWDADDDADVVA